jgi:hypothetical protein
MQEPPVIKHVVFKLARLWNVNEILRQALHDLEDNNTCFVLRPFTEGKDKHGIFGLHAYLRQNQPKSFLPDPRGIQRRTVSMHQGPKQVPSKVTHREKSSKSSHIALFSEGARRRIVASLRRIPRLLIPRRVTSPRASIALPDKVPGPHIVEVSVVVLCESDRV